MAVPAVGIGVCAGQWEVGAIVVKGDILPASRRMAGGTFLTKLPFVVIILFVAGETIRGRPQGDRG